MNIIEAFALVEQEKMIRYTDKRGRKHVFFQMRSPLGFMKVFEIPMSAATYKYPAGLENLDPSEVYDVEFSAISTDSFEEVTGPQILKEFQDMWKKEKDEDLKERATSDSE